MSWVNPDFTAEEAKKPNATTKGLLDANGISCTTKGKAAEMSHSLWADCFAPENKEHLAVHVNKISDVDLWLNQAFHGSMGVGTVVLIVGPSGSGKTATLRVLARSMGIAVKEWINPTSTKQPFNTFLSHPRRELSGPSGQVEQFEDFLFRASRYQDLFSCNNSKSLLLVEDIPNIFLRDPSLLEKTLRKYVVVGRSPLVFILSSGLTEIEKTVFKPQLLTDLKIAHISFNPVNKTLMSRALERVKKLAFMQDPKLVRKAKVSLDDAIALSNGDIRFAVNHLQLLMTGNNGAHPVPSSPLKAVIPLRKRKEKTRPSDIVISGLKDQKADIFKYLGRVLYNSMENVIDETTGKVQAILKHDPEEISSKMSSMPNLFHGLLTENYCGVMNDMKNISVASSLLSQTDVIMATSTASEKEVYKMYAVNVSVHGLMNLPPDNAQRKFFSFRGSKVKEVLLSMRERQKTCRNLFPGTCIQPQTLLTEVCPILIHMDMAALTFDQKKFIHEVAQSKFIRKTTVKSVHREENDSDNEAGLQVMTVLEVPTSPVAEGLEMETHQEEVILIEEYCSDDSNED